MQEVLLVTKIGLKVLVVLQSVFNVCDFYAL